MGEHTDYNGLPVLPMALTREVRVLFRPREDQEVTMGNLAGEFETRWFPLTGEIPRNEEGDWGNYLKAPCQALCRRFGTLRGFDGLVVSTLPVAAGLSSSSALVNAAALALLHANELEIPALELAEEMARAERYTGTRGGGMDQAISLCARAGHASLVRFHPLGLCHTPIPPGWRFLVAHTLVRAEKSGPARDAYNARRRECEEALALVETAIRKGAIPLRRDQPWVWKGGTARNGTGTDSAAATPDAAAAPDAPGGPIPLGYPELLALAPAGELVEAAARVLPPELLPRFRHVVTEEARVRAAADAMHGKDLTTFGSLMDASHRSLRADYQVSSPELDRLVELARGAGARGARLTGAGFGGCVVALAEEDQAPSVMEALEAGYFSQRRGFRRLSDVLFSVEPGPGASVFPL